jgi:ABC-type Na+ efflux pump permease subunit
MGRIIGGVVVGFIAAIVAVVILSLILVFVLGTGNIVMPETYEPTTIYMAVMLILGVAVHFLGSAIARAIAKDKKSLYFYVGIIVALGVWGILAAGGDKTPPPNMPEPSMDMNPFIASFYAQLNSPKWMVFASPVVGIVGALLGGMSKGDVAKKDAGAA